MTTDHRDDEDVVLPTGASGQPAFAVYRRGDDGDGQASRPFDLTLFPTFGPPMTLPADEQAVLAAVNP